MLTTTDVGNATRGWNHGTRSPSVAPLWCSAFPDNLPFEEKEGLGTVVLLHLALRGRGLRVPCTGGAKLRNLPLAAPCAPYNYGPRAKSVFCMPCCSHVSGRGGGIAIKASDMCWMVVWGVNHKGKVGLPVGAFGFTPRGGCSSLRNCSSTVSWGAVVFVERGGGLGECNFVAENGNCVLMLTVAAHCPDGVHSPASAASRQLPAASRWHRGHTPPRTPWAKCLQTQATTMCNTW